jgi:histidyl-tRNA synthetase
VRAQLYAEQKKFKAKIQYADKLGIPYVLFLGEDELAAGVVTCKDMAAGEQTKLPVGDTIALIKAGVAAKNRGPVILG